ncbi:MAG TPA: hypothetical protein VII73_00655 [Caulobacteraceae bacterium]
MTGDIFNRQLPVTRRRLFRDGVVLAGGAVIAGGVLAAGPASAKASQKGVAYQTMPKGAQRCDKCSFWQAPASCKVVAGVISPAGWCNLYAPK